MWQGALTGSSQKHGNAVEGVSDWENFLGGEVGNKELRCVQLKNGRYGTERTECQYRETQTSSASCRFPTGLSLCALNAFLQISLSIFYF